MPDRVSLVTLHKHVGADCYRSSAPNCVMCAGCSMKWSEFAPLPSPIAFAGAGSIFGHVYLIGGCDSGNKWLDSVLRCAPPSSSQAWTTART